MGNTVKTAGLFAFLSILSIQVEAFEKDHLLMKYSFADMSGDTLENESYNDALDAVNHGAVATAWGGVPKDGVFFNSSQSNYIELPYVYQSFSSGFAFSVWAQYTGLNHWSRLIEFGHGAANNNLIFANCGTSDDLCFSSWKNGAYQGTVVAPDAIDTWGWHQYAVVGEQGGAITLFVDGIAVAEGQLTLPTSNIWSTNYIGRSTWSGDGYYAGYMDNVHIFNHPVSDETIYDLYIETKLKMEYECTSNPDGTLIDSSDNRAHGQISEDNSFQYQLSKIKDGIYYDNFRYGILPTTYFNSEGITFEIWIYQWYHDDANWSRMFEFGNGAGQDNIIFGTVANTADVFFEVKRAGEPARYVIAEDAMDDVEFGNGNEWHHFAVSYENQSGYTAIYKDGEFLNDGYTNLAANVVRSYNYLAHSSWSGDSMASGEMDEIRVYNTALDGDTIARHHREYQTVVDYSCDVIYNDKLIDNSFRERDGNETGVTTSSYRAKQGKAIYFNSDADRVQIPWLAFQPEWEGGFSFEGWVQFTSNEPWSSVLQLTGPGLLIQIGQWDDTDDLFFEVMEEGETLGYIRAANLIERYSYVHIAATLAYSPSNPNIYQLKIYKNGTLVKSGNISSTDASITSWIFDNNYLGHAIWSERANFRGYMDNIKLHTRTLDATEIAEIYNTTN